MTTSPLIDRWLAVQARVIGAARTAGRDPASLTLVAVSKTHPLADIETLAAHGQLHFGESRLEEAAPKVAALPGVYWHMVGHIQSRKAAAVVATPFHLVQSVDSAKLAHRLARLAVEAGRVLPVLLECNVSGEASKSGFAAHDENQWQTLCADLLAVAALPGLHVRGLMTLAPVVPHPDEARPFFARLRRLQAHLHTLGLSAPELSMGMTDDFEAAIAEGATLVRVGRAIFGERI